MSSNCIISCSTFSTFNILLLWLAVLEGVKLYLMMSLLCNISLLMLSIFASDYWPLIDPLWESLLLAYSYFPHFAIGLLQLFSYPKYKSFEIHQKYFSPTLGLSTLFLSGVFFCFFVSTHVSACQGPMLGHSYKQSHRSDNTGSLAC